MPVESPSKLLRPYLIQDQSDIPHNSEWLHPIRHQHQDGSRTSSRIFPLDIRKYILAGNQLDFPAINFGSLSESSPTPWHALAVRAIERCGIGAEPLMFNKIRLHFATTRDSVYGLTANVMLTHERAAREELLRVFEGLELQKSAKWCSDNTPLQSALFTSIACFYLGSQVARRWGQEFYPDIFARQTDKKGYSWWRATSLDLKDHSELNGMTATEADIYTTSMLLLTLPPPRWLPSFDPLIKPDINVYDGIDVEIDL